MNKIFLKKLFLILVIWVGAFFVFALPAAAVYELEIGLPGLPEGSVVGGPAQYIRSFFIFGLSLIGFIAVVALIIGGIQYMLSGTVTSVEKSKKTIFAALQGVVLLICAALLLSLIDPSLTNLAPSNPPNLQITKFGLPLYEEKVDPSIPLTERSKKRTQELEDKGMDPTLAYIKTEAEGKVITYCSSGVAKDKQACINGIENFYSEITPYYAVCAEPYRSQKISLSEFNECREKNNVSDQQINKKILDIIKNSN